MFHSDTAVLHTVAPAGAGRSSPLCWASIGPEVWVSDRYAGQQELGRAYQVYLAYVLGDVQYAIDRGDSVVTPEIRDHLRWTIRVGHRRPRLKDSTLAAYAAKAERGLDALLGVLAAYPAGYELQRQIKAWRSKFFVFLSDRRVPPANNGSEQEIRPSVIFHKVANGFRSDWGPDIHAGYCPVTGTVRRQGKSAWTAIQALVGGTFAVA